MLKKICILFLSVHLCAAENIKTLELSRSNNASAKIIGLGLTTLIVYTIIPNILEKSDGQCLAALASAVVGAYSFIQLYIFNRGSNEISYDSHEAQETSTSEALET